MNSAKVWLYKPLLRPNYTTANTREYEGRFQNQPCKIKGEGVRGNYINMTTTEVHK